MKAELIIDMPECCGECPLMNDDCAGGYCNAHNDDYIDIPDTMGGKPEWCPLTEMQDEERYTYTLEHIVDAVVQADEEIVSAITRKDREMLESALRDSLAY